MNIYTRHDQKVFTPKLSSVTKACKSEKSNQPQMIGNSAQVTTYSPSITLHRSIHHPYA